jgi:hypothetical protein
MFVRDQDRIELCSINLNRRKPLFETAQRKSGIEEQTGFAAVDVESISFAAAG